MSIDALMNGIPLILTDPINIYENGEPLTNSFQEVAAKPRIAVKSFAKVSCLEQQVKQKNFKSPEEQLQNLVVVIDAVARGVNAQTHTINNLQDPVSDGSDVYPELEGTTRKKKNKNRPSTRQRNRKTTIKEEICYCLICNNQKELTRKQLQQHLLFHGTPDTLCSPQDESIYCEVCSKTFKNSIVFCLHSIKHSDNRKYSCHICKYRTVSKHGMEKHVKAHEGKTLYNCEICKKGFTNSARAIGHKNFHTGEKPFVCDICEKAFTSSNILSQHRRYQHWETLGLSRVKYDCKLCDKKYISRKSYDLHMKRQHVKGFDESGLCEICGKRLSNKDNLKFHRRIHTGYKPHSCNICNKSFTKKELLKEHVRVHSGDKPFKCRHCSKCFSQRSSRKIHERIHTGERPYICRLCKKGFISKGVMDLHMKRCDGISKDLG